MPSTLFHELREMMVAAQGFALVFSRDTGPDAPDHLRQTVRRMGEVSTGFINSDRARTDWRCEGIMEVPVPNIRQMTEVHMHIVTLAERTAHACPDAWAALSARAADLTGDVSGLRAHLERASVKNIPSPAVIAATAALRGLHA